MAEYRKVITVQESCKALSDIVNNPDDFLIVSKELIGDDDDEKDDDDEILYQYIEDEEEQTNKERLYDLLSYCLGAENPSPCNSKSVDY